MYIFFFCMREGKNVACFSTSEADGGVSRLRRRSGGDPAGRTKTQIFSLAHNSWQKMSSYDGRDRIWMWGAHTHTPALLSFQELAVGGDFNIQGHLHVEEVLVLSQVTSHVVLWINTQEVLLSAQKTPKTNKINCWKIEVEPQTRTAFSQEVHPLTMITFILAMSASSRAIVSWKPDASRPMRSSMSLIWRSRDSFCGGAEWLKNRTNKIERGRSLRKKERKKGRKGPGDTYSALERVDLAGVGLDLVPVLHALLLGLTQCIIVLVHSLVQIGHLRREGRRF